MPYRPALPSRRAVALLTAAYTVLSLVYLLTTPPFEAPDESLHFFYAHHLRAGRGLPVLPPGPDDGWGQEGAQPPFAYLLLSLPAWIAPADASPRDVLANPYIEPGWNAAPDNVNWYILRPEQRALPGDDLTRAVRAARMVSLAAGMVAVVGAARLAGFVLGSPALALAAAAAMAFTPQFLFLSGAVTNDVVLVAIATWTLALAAESLVAPLPRAKLLALGGLVGLLPLTKVSGGLIAVAALAALLLSPHLSRRKRAGQAATVLLIAALLIGWWLVRNVLLYGGPLGLDAHLATIGHRAAPPTLMEFVTNGELAALFISYWGLFGWQSVPLPQSTYLALATIVGAAFTGLLMSLVRRHLLPRHNAEALRRRVWTSSAAACLMTGAAALVLAGVWVWNIQVVAAQGRLLFPALAPLSILLVAGLAALGPPFWRDGAAKALVAALFMLSAVAPFAVIGPRYAPPLTSPTAPDAPTLARFGSGLVLEAARVSPDAAEPGAFVTVELAWRAEHPVEDNYAVGLQIASPDWEPLAHRDSFPGGGLTATSLWTPGVTLLDQHPMALDVAAARPQQAQVAVSVYERATGSPLPVTDAAGNPTGSAVTVAYVRVPPFPPPATLPEETLTLGRFPGIGVEVLRAGPIPGAAVPGETLRWDILWRVAGAGSRAGDLRVSLQLLDQNGVLMAQYDRAPMGGRFPMAAWRPGDLLADSHELPLPAVLPPGVYRPVIIVYDGLTGQRQPALSPDNAPGEALDLGALTVTGGRPPR